MKRIKLKSRFGDTYNTNIFKSKYKDGGIALLGIDSDDGQPIATFTANLIEQAPLEGHAWIKDYSENEGFMRQLIDEQIISQPVGSVQSGYAELYLCKVLI